MAQPVEVAPAHTHAMSSAHAGSFTVPTVASSTLMNGRQKPIQKAAGAAPARLRPLRGP
jgi:hypothetical protein